MIARIAYPLVLLVALLAGSPSFAQALDIIEANKKYQAGDLLGARALLDAAVAKPELARSPEAWVLRGFVYKDLFKANPVAPTADDLRSEALGSLFTSTVLDSSKEYSQSSLQAYDYLCKTIYNDAARALNELDAARALTLYSRYKENVLRLDPDHAFKERDIEFNNALGTVYTKKFNQDREDTAWFAKAVALYKKVLELDSNNYGANYNLATLFYNRGVYNIQRISSNTDIPTIGQIQDASKQYFVKALPYMKKAHDMNPKRRETILGLEGIYYSLQDIPESERYRHLFEEIEQDPSPQPQKDK